MSLNIMTNLCQRTHLNSDHISKAEPDRKNLRQDRTREVMTSKCRCFNLQPSGPVLLQQHKNPKSMPQIFHIEYHLINYYAKDSHDFSKYNSRSVKKITWKSMSNMTCTFIAIRWCESPNIVIFALSFIDYRDCITH